MDLIKNMDRLINRFIFEGKKFVDVSAHPYGLMDLIQYGEKSDKLLYDFEYFTFTKSTKTLMSIRNLLRIGHNEDGIILARSIFENYLSCRYLQENEEKIDSFIANPLGLALAHYNLRFNEEKQATEIINRQEEVIGNLENPSKFKTGEDKKYYYTFYDFLCTFTHCNFGVLECYSKNSGLYAYDKVNHAELSRLISIFVFSKIFEAVVTVEGEEFFDKQHEKSCYELVKESIQLQEQVFDVLISRYQTDEGEFYKHRNKRMREMLKAMKKSLKEKIGSVDKSDL
ncbi:DUF5677 domain-containing protein [Bacillus thuringiensis]|nr:DUF5677 domain-containing protein [Bacillus thuringiensis]MRB59403.1 hypothetical protein [Bacillus thuringiensis]